MNTDYQTNEAYYHLYEVGKRSKKERSKKSFPTIQRSDVMEGILSEFAKEQEKRLLSIMYFEITRMEMKDMKYITEIAISSQSDADIYDIIKRLKRQEKNKLKYIQNLEPVRIQENRKD